MTIAASLHKNLDLYAKSSIGKFYSVSYSEMINVLEYLRPDSLFSTDHGVKGEEYDNVLFVIGRGWNEYRFDEVLYKNLSQLSEKDADFYRKNRNLFYVCCSRPIKNLTLLITVKINKEFEQYLKRIFGEDSIISYSDFIGEKY